eukprot:COSAG06_NODE_2553_length_6682_cov_137.987999_6_plen_285_part_00
MPLVRAAFGEPGSLGLGFEATDARSAPRIKEIKPGTQATQHAAVLEVGMTLVAVGHVTCTSALAYGDCIGLIKAHPQRPITLEFYQGLRPSAEALLAAGDEGWGEDISYIMRSGSVFIDAADEMTGNSALLNAAVGGHVDATAECVRLGAQLNFRCSLDQSALIKAAGMGHTAVATVLLDAAAAAADGADRVELLNWADHRGMSAYLYACQHGHRDVVELLCAAGCERAQTNREGLGGKELAESWSRSHVLTLLGSLGEEVGAGSGGPARMGKAKGKARTAREA